MKLLIFVTCIPMALLIYFGILKPLIVPLTRRIPTGREYRPTLSKF